LDILKNGAYMIRLEDGWQKTFVIDGMIYPVRKCRHCSRDIAFVPTASGKRQPRDSDGGVHFATCPVYVARRKQKQAARLVEQPRLF
jgi:hypothetical protein